MTARILGIALLAAGACIAATILVQAYRDREALRKEPGRFPFLCVTEVVLYFLATLGISDYLMNTLLIKRFDLTDDKKLPGTLVVTGLVPSAVIASFLLRAEQTVEPRTLLPCLLSMLLGSVSGVRLVQGMDGARIKKVMGFALIGSFFALIVRMVVSHGAPGELIALSAPKLAFAVVFSFFWGAVNMIGVPMKPAGSAMFLLLGMTPLATLTLILVMGSIGPMGGGIAFLRNRQYAAKIACSAVCGGVIGAVLGSVFAISVNAMLLNVLLLCVMVIAIFMMFR
ncbi:MAG: sulfite exporter TauE/SafE family protein [Lachnospiraceae bacterium]|nr:sulfite exporter TauE/SafE family protein [Lachnospiraceae bacterium]